MTYGFLALAIYGWLTGKDTPVGIVLLAFVMAATAKGARATILRYRAWEREWNGIEDPAPRARRRRSFTLFLALVCLGSLIWTMSYPANGPDGDRVVAEAMFLLTAAALVLRMLYVLLSRLRTWRRDRREATASIVRLSLPLPRNAPTVAEATAALPSYCKDLLSRSSH
jgi:hypothetical protein